MLDLRTKRRQVDSGMIQPESIGAIMTEFLHGLGAAVEDLLTRAPSRTQEQVIALEDLFHSAHNAVRRAQLGEQTVPPRV